MLVSDLVSYALRISGILGVGQVALAQDTADALTAFTVMLTQWQARRWLVFRLEELECPVVSAQPTYSVGPGGDLDTGSARRPTDIEAAYIRQLIGSAGPSSLPVDFLLRRIDSREEWSRIALKNLQSWPGRYFYDPVVPQGVFYVWPIPIQTFFELHVAAKPDISQWVQPGTDTDTILPAEADEALIYGLASTLRANYQLPPSPGIELKATTTLRTLRSTNFRIGRLNMPMGLSRRGGRIKNPQGGFYPETSVGVPYSTTVP